MNWPRCGLVAVVCATAAAQSVLETQQPDTRGSAALQGYRHMDVGYALAGQGKRREAIEEYKQALALNRQALGATHLRTLTNMNLLASACLMSGDLDGVEPLLNEVIAAARELYPQDIQLAAALGSLSYIRSSQGKLPEAQSLAGEALALSLTIEGEESVTSAMMYANAAEIHRLAGDNARALPLYRKARAIYEKKLDPANPQELHAPRIASLLSQEGLILMHDNQVTLAEHAMTRALEMLRESCPGCVAECWIAEGNLALLRMKQKKYDEADRLLSHVLSMQEKYLSRAGRDTVLTLQTLAAVREKQRRHRDAILLIKRADRLLAYQ